VTGREAGWECGSQRGGQKRLRNTFGIVLANLALVGRAPSDVGARAELG
jgi:hypothetical protein